MENPARPPEPPQRRPPRYGNIARQLAYEQACLLQGINQPASDMLATVVQTTGAANIPAAQEAFSLFWLTHPFTIPLDAYISLRKSLFDLWDKQHPEEATA